MNEASDEQTAFAIVMATLIAAGTVVKAWPAVAWCGRFIYGIVPFLIAAATGPATLARMAVKLDDVGKKQDRMAETLSTVRSLQFAEIETSEFGVWLSEPSGSCTYASANLCHIMGRSEREILGWEWMNAIHPDDHARVVTEWTNAVARGHDFICTYRYVTAAGLPVKVSVRAVQLRNELRQVTGYMGKARIVA